MESGPHAGPVSGLLLKQASERGGGELGTTGLLERRAVGAHAVPRSPAQEQTLRRQQGCSGTKAQGGGRRPSKG